ncbi:hypothetical protein QUB56_36245 [Microcoleus sp. AR_TQ3_B6]|uniref:hypothetical protein n=1 Tax=Microcoleus sp. AR_TQ3_B6 TaxID=3055284 RepID=UPI002FD5C285
MLAISSFVAALPNRLLGCDRAALPEPTVGRSAINLVYCRSPVKRKRFNHLSDRHFKRLRVFFTTKTLEGTAP